MKLSNEDILNECSTKQEKSAVGETNDQLPRSQRERRLPTRLQTSFVVEDVVVQDLKKPERGSKLSTKKRVAGTKKTSSKYIFK